MIPSKMKISSTEGTIKRLKNQIVIAMLIEGIAVPITFHWTSPPWQELILIYNTAITYYYHDQRISIRLVLHVFREKSILIILRTLHIFLYACVFICHQARQIREQYQICLPPAYCNTIMSRWTSQKV